MESELFDFLRRIRQRVASSTYRRKSWMAGAFLRYLAASGKRYLDVKQADVEAFLLSLDASRQHRQAVCCTVREFFDFLKVSNNPAADIRFKPDRSRRLPNAPSQAAVDAIFARLDDRGDDLRIRNRLMTELAYGSGLRRGELARLDIEDIDCADNTARVRGKGDKMRIVPITGRAVECIREYLARRHASRGPLLVTQRGRRLSVQTVYYVMRDRVGVRPHALRHACATHMLRSGCGVRVLQELLGHNRLSTTCLYTAVEKEELRRVVNARHPGNRGA